MFVGFIHITAPHYIYRFMTTHQKQIIVSIVEDQPTMLSSLSELLKTQPDFKVGQTAPRVEDFLLLDHEVYPPDIILLDINLKGGMTGVEGIKPIKAILPKVEIIILTTFDDSTRIFQALCAGATAYLTKQTPFDKIMEAIRTVNSGGSYMSPGIAKKVVDYFKPSTQPTQLTPRQMQIVEAIVDGLSYKLIADKLLISIETVRDHIKHIYKALEINSKAELIKKKLGGELD